MENIVMPHHRRMQWCVLAAIVCTAFASGVGAAAGSPWLQTPTAWHHVTSQLPPWLAPGAPLTVDGWTGRGARVALFAGGRQLGETVAGPLGSFTVSGPVPTQGAYRVALAIDGSRSSLGRLTVRPIQLAAVGDVTPGEGVSSTIDAHGTAYPWLSVAPVLRHADIATANLEGVISDRGVPVPDKEFHFEGDSGLLAGAARTAGIDVVTVANNHSLDFGPTAFLDTLGAAHAAGIQTVGGGADLASARRPVVLSVGGLRVAMLGYSDVRPAGFDAGPSTPGTAPADPAEIAHDVRAARRHADLVVVWFHWGVELDQQPTERQRELAAVAFGAGASLVLGAHPHVLQPLARDGHKLVAWSLGNFVFPSHSPTTYRTGILEVSLTARGVTSAHIEPATIVGFRPKLSAAERRTATSARH